MTALVFEWLTGLLLASLIFVAYANVRMNRRSRSQAPAEDERLLSSGERAGRLFSRNTRWMTDPVLKRDRRLLFLGVAAALAAILGMILTGAMTGQLKFASEKACRQAEGGCPRP